MVDIRIYLDRNFPVAAQRKRPISPRTDEARDPLAAAAWYPDRDATHERAAEGEVVTADALTAARRLVDVEGRARTVGGVLDDGSTATAERLVAAHARAENQPNSVDGECMSVKAARSIRCYVRYLSPKPRLLILGV